MSKNSILNTKSSFIHNCGLLRLRLKATSEGDGLGLHAELSDWVQFPVESATTVHVLPVLAFLLYVCDINVVASHMLSLS